MPLCRFTRVNKDSAHLLWRIDEPQEVLLRGSVLSMLAQEEYEKITHPRRKREWLAARLTLKTLLAKLGHEYTGLQKDAQGRPYLVNNSLHLSIAHCYPFAFVAVDQQRAIGIDIQLLCQKLQAVKEKFLNHKEMRESNNDLEKLCIYWCAKEAIYKAYGGKGLSFKRDISVNKFTKKQHGTVWGAVGPQLFVIHYKFYADHVLAWSKEASIQVSILDSSQAASEEVIFF
jgi:4'-phosphopantetheinyl transferase